MRKALLLLLAILIVPNVTIAAHKHAERLHNKVHDMGHKKRMKKAAKQSAPPKKPLLHHHK